MTSADKNTRYYLLYPFMSSRLVLSTLFFSIVLGDGWRGADAITKLDFATNVVFTKVKAGLNEVYV